MWTYVIAFRNGEDVDHSPFLMVRSKKRGGWEMPGGRLEKGETCLSSARREFLEETGRLLSTDDDLSVPLKEGRVFFGFADEKISRKIIENEILDVAWFWDLPDDLAYPHEEYVPLIIKGRSMLRVR